MKRITISIPDLIYEILMERKDENYHSLSKEIYFLLVKGLGENGYDEKAIYEEIENVKKA